MIPDPVPMHPGALNVGTAGDPDHWVRTAAAIRTSGDEMNAAIASLGPVLERLVAMHRLDPDWVRRERRRLRYLRRYGRRGLARLAGRRR